MDGRFPWPRCVFFRYSLRACTQYTGGTRERESSPAEGIMEGFNCKIFKSVAEPVNTSVDHLK